jgi:uracil-DNA glycosylase
MTAGMNCPPDADCGLCPRLSAFRAKNRKSFPDKFNAPVPSFGPVDAKLLIVGLAPGLRGANFTGRPFTGDWAGDLLYDTLLKFGFAKGKYDERPDDGLTLTSCRITNAVRCVPPENKPTPQEISTCRPFLETEIAALPKLKVILSLGKISHDAVVRTFGKKLSACTFAHGAVHQLGCHTGESWDSVNKKHRIPAFAGMTKEVTLIDSYHCSRYNTNTRRLTEDMFHQVFDEIKDLLKG